MFSFGMLSTVSKGALEREKQAKESFRQAKCELEQTALFQSLKFGSKHTIQLLQPNFHLTQHTWGTFRDWVEENHDGWKAKRRQASTDEMAATGCPSRGKGYFVDVVYQDPASIKTKRKKKKKKDDDDAKPLAKKAKPAPPKNRIGPFDFISLPKQLQHVVLSFLDVPTLGKTVRVSKDVGVLAKSDDLWAPHLKFLLEELYDGAFEWFPDQ
jgi:hypothetical protein